MDRDFASIMEDLPKPFVSRYEVSKYPAKYFRELRAKGFRNKTISEMYGISEMKVRKVINKYPDDKRVTVFVWESVPLLGHYLGFYDELCDEECHKWDYLDLKKIRSQF